MYRSNSKRAIRRLMAEVPLARVKDLRQEIIEPWFAHALEMGMKARTRNYYRESVVRFAHWLEDNGKLHAHNLDKLPKADERANPVRPRRALTADEFDRLLAVARTRPLNDARTVHRGRGKGNNSRNSAQKSSLDSNCKAGNGC